MRIFWQTAAWFPLFLADELMVKYIWYFPYILFYAFQGNLLILTNSFLEINTICMDCFSREMLIVLFGCLLEYVLKMLADSYASGCVFFVLVKIGVYI